VKEEAQSVPPRVRKLSRVIYDSPNRDRILRHLCAILQMSSAKEGDSRGE